MRTKSEKGKRMTKKWHIFLSLTAFLMLVATTLYPSAWSLDLSVQENVYSYTSVEDIQSQPAHAKTTVPVGFQKQQPTTSFEAIQSLEYRPNTQQALQLRPGSPATIEAQPATLSAPNPEVQGQPATLNPSPQAPSQLQSINTSSPGIAIFPVMYHSNQNKAFSDLPLILSTAVAKEFRIKFAKENQPFHVMNPIYAYDRLKARGADGVYQKVMRDYIEAGEPDENDIMTLANQLSTKDHPVDWVIFVGSTFDYNQLTRPSGLLEKYLYYHHDQLPKQPNFYVTGNMQVYNVQNGSMVLVYQRRAEAKVPLNAFENFTKSVFDDSDSMIQFKLVSDKLAQKMALTTFPKPTGPQVGISAKLATEQDATPPGTQVLSQDVKDSLKRILSRPTSKSQ